MIDSTHNSSPLGRMNHLHGPAKNAQQSARGEQSQPPSDSLSVEGASSVRQKLEALPVVRTEVVETGRKLAASPDYPPHSVVRTIAETILQSPDMIEAP